MIWDISAALAALLILAILSYAFVGGSLVYDVAQDLAVAAAVGYQTIMAYESMLRVGWTPMVSNFGANWHYIIPILASFLLFTTVSRKYVWMSRWPSSWMLGVGLGLAMATFAYADIYMQIVQSWNLGFGYVEWLVIVIGMPLTIWFFVYTVPHGKSGTTRTVLDRAADFGKAFVMIYITSKYASTVMYRLTILTGNLQRVFWDWLGTSASVF